MGLFHENEFWYVLGYCHMRLEYRQFRTDRMLEIKRPDLPCTLEHGTLDEHRQKKKVIPKILVRILVDKSIVGYIQSSKKQHGFVSEKVNGNQVEKRFMTSDLEHWFPRWYLTFCDYAEILEPESLKLRIKEILRKAEAKIRS